MDSNVFVLFMLLAASLSASYSARHELDAINTLSLEEEFATAISQIDIPICNPEDPVGSCPPPPGPPPSPPPAPCPPPPPAPCPPPPPPVTCSHCFCSIFLPQLHCVCLDVFKLHCLPACTNCVCGSINNLSVCVCLDFQLHQCSGPAPGLSAAALLPPVN